MHKVFYMQFIDIKVDILWEIIHQVITDKLNFTMFANINGDFKSRNYALLEDIYRGENLMVSSI